jgi:hypothetical protein
MKEFLMEFQLDENISDLGTPPVPPVVTDELNLEPEAEPEETDAEILTEARERFKICMEMSEEIRDNALSDLLFLSGDDENKNQWTQTALSERALYGRPAITVNKLPTTVNQVANDIRQNNPSIKVRPVDSVTDPATAEVISGLIRTIDYKSAVDNATYYAVACGEGFFRISTRWIEGTFDQEIIVERIENPLSVYFPINIIKMADYSDAPYCFVRFVISKDEFKAKYPNQPDMSHWDGGTGDRNWVEENAVWIAEYFRVEETPVTLYKLSNGEVVEEVPDSILYPDITVVDDRESTKRKVMRYLITQFSILERNEIPSRYIPVVPILGQEMNVDNKKIYNSLIRFAKDPQRKYNHLKSAEIEIIALAPISPFMCAEGVTDGHEDEWAVLNKKHLAKITYKPDIRLPSAGMPQRIDPPQVPGAVVNAIREASDDIKACTGVFDAGLGAKGNETSGRAIIARTRQSDTVTYHFVESVTAAVKLMGKIFIDMIPVLYDVPRAIRILGEDMQDEIVMVNQLHKTFNNDNRLYDLKTGRYDLIVSVGPSYESRRIEAAQNLINLIQSVPQIGLVSSDILVRNLDFPGAQELSDRLRKTIPPNLLEKESFGKNITEPQLREIIADLEKQMAIVATLQQQRAQMGQMIQALQKQLADKLQAEQIKADTAVIRASSEVKKSQLALEQEKIKQGFAQSRHAVDTAIDFANRNITGQYQPEGPAPTPRQF